MKRRTERWVRFAETDFRTSEHLFVTLDIPEVVCFHAQQCIEKYLKAALAEADRSIPRTHNLGTLYQLVKDLIPELDAYSANLIRVSAFAVGTRYPSADESDEDFSEVVELAVQTMEIVRQFIRAHLGAPNEADG
jgi:HEPN domain-containing protein